MDHVNANTLQNKTFTRRAFFIAGVQTLGVFGLGTRLAWLQMAQGARYKTLSENNRVNVKLLPPTRGQIFDRYGVALTTNQKSFRVLIVPEQTENVEEALFKLSKIIDLDQRDFNRTLKRVRSSAKFVSVEVRDDLSWKDVTRIEVNIPNLPGVFIDSGDLRSYPKGVPSAHIAGYVGLPKPEQLEDDPMLNLPGFKIGKTGLERGFDTELRGQAGAAQVEVNAVGREVRELGRKISHKGHSLTTSLDMVLQEAVYERLSRYKSASAVVMDAHTGAVYAMASYPSYDPNLFTHGMSSQTWQGLLKDKGLPLTNKAIAGQYPPASTFKMMTAIAGMRSGHVNRKRHVHCSGRYEYGSDKFHCWKLSGHGYLNLVDALAMSCDTYFYELAIEVGIDKIAATAREFGLGSRFNFDLPEEKSGLIPDKKWKLGKMGKPWKPGETIVSSIGQGSLLATPLQMAVMTARLVNGGYAVQPWLTGYVGGTPVFRNSWPKMNVDDKHLAHVKDGMDKVVNHREGTAFKSRIEQAGMMMGGKTGTAQVKKINRAQRARGIMNEDLIWKHRHHAIFVGYAPYDNPRYVCSVVVEHGGGGSKIAAPIARDILLETQKRNPAGHSLSPVNERRGQS